MSISPPTHPHPPTPPVFRLNIHQSLGVIIIFCAIVANVSGHFRKDLSSFLLILLKRDLSTFSVTNYKEYFCQYLDADVYTNRRVARQACSVSTDVRLLR